MRRLTPFHCSCLIYGTAHQAGDINKPTGSMKARGMGANKRKTLLIAAPCKRSHCHRNPLTRHDSDTSTDHTMLISYLQCPDLLLCQVVGGGTLGPEPLQVGDADVYHVLYQLALLQGFLQTQRLIFAAGHIFFIHFSPLCSAITLSFPPTLPPEIMLIKKKLSRVLFPALSPSPTGAPLPPSTPVCVQHRCMERAASDVHPVH